MKDSNEKLLQKNIEVSNRFAYHVGVPNYTRCYIDRYGRSIIYDEWYGKPEYVSKDEKIQLRNQAISQVLIGASILLIFIIIGL